MKLRKNHKSAVENISKSKNKSSSEKKPKVKIANKVIQRKSMKKKLKRKCYSLESLENAMKAVNEGASLREASQSYGVPRATLCRKLKSPESLSKKGGPPTVLTAAEEEDVVMWLLYRAATGSPVTKNELFDCVETYLSKEEKQTCFKNNRPGKKWYYGFQKRHPNISLRAAQNLSLVRASVTEEDLREWFGEVKLYLQNKGLINVQASRIFNCDETNIQLHPKAEKVLAEKGARTVYKVIDAPERENATALFMYNAEGTRAPPMILYTYKEVPKKVLQNCPEGWGVGLSDSGWMNTETFYEYVTRVFYPWLIKSEIEFPVVVYMDGHSSHATLPLVKFCKEKGIELITLYAHSTHIIQPLDIAFFHPLKEVYNKKAVPKWKKENDNRRLKKEDFPKVLKLALDLFEEEKKVIVNGFKSAGLYPFDPDNVDYNVLKKKKKSKKVMTESEIIEKNDSSKNLFEEHQQHLKFFEDNLPPDILNAFQACEGSEEWDGAIENQGLFSYWLMLRKKAFGTLPVEDNENIGISNKSVRELPKVKSIEVVHYDFLQDIIKNTDKVQVPYYEINQPTFQEQTSNEVISNTFHDDLLKPTLEQQISVEEPLQIPLEFEFLKNFCSENELKILSSPNNDEFIKDNLLPVDNVGEPTSEIPECQLNIIETKNLSDKMDVSDKFEESVNATDPTGNKDNFGESFTLPMQYLPKNKKTKLQAKGKKKLPAVGTSEEWIKIQLEKEQEKKAKEEKLAKAKEIREKKKKLIEEKKKLDNELKNIQKKIKQEP